jgi:hypothetical protein
MEQILFIKSNLGYWGNIEDHTSIDLTIDSHIGTLDSDKSKLLDISKSNYVPTEGDKIYFMPEVNIPRVKFKNLAFEKKIRAVRDVENANIIFANRNSLYKITTTKSEYIITTEQFKGLMKDPLFMSKLDSKYKNALETALEFYTYDKIFVDRAIANACTVNKDFSDIEYDTMLILEKDYANIIEHCKGKMIFDEGGVVDLLNGEASSVIDADMFKQLSTMFESSDTDNHILAMEIMANCKYNASLPYMLLLFKEYYYKMHNCHTKNHVNFKSLTGWVGHDILNRNDLDTLCRVLEDKGQYEPDKLDILLNHSHQDILQRGQSNYFTIKVISLNPEHTIPGYDYKVIPEAEETEEELESEFAAEDNFDEAIESVIDLMESTETIEEEIVSEFELTTEVSEETLEIPEVLNTNQKIEKTNESDDFEWF